MPGTTRTPARRAVVADVDALVRLRAQMLEAMDIPTGGPTAPWRAAAAVWFSEQLTRTDRFAAYVVDDPRSGVVSTAIGMCDEHAPGPGNESGLKGYVFNVSTDPGHRRHGYARACLEALLEWFRAETSVLVVDLYATAYGSDLYTTLGFAVPRYPALRLNLPRGSDSIDGHPGSA